MLFNANLEFRGSNDVTSDNGKTYHYFNVEDSNGESAKLLSDFSSKDFELEKGMKYDFVLDYSTRYSSLRIRGVE